MLRKNFRKFRRSWTGVLIGAIIVTAPGALQKLSEKPANPWLPDPITKAFEAHPLFKAICEVWPVFIAVGVLALDKFCDSKTDDVPDGKTLIALILQLANAVGLKSASHHCKASIKLGKPPQSIHQSSADAQMRALVAGVWQIFNLEALDNGMDENRVVKVTLAEVDEACAFRSFRAFHPMNLQPQVPQSFYGKNTGFAVAARGKQIVIMQDLDLEVKRKKRYVPSTTHDSGSMICFPIDIHPLPGRPSVPLVLSIKCDHPKAFRASKQLRYIFLIQPFADRIRLEYYNELLEG